MARKGKGNRYSGYIKGPIEQGLPLATLGSKVLLSGTFAEVMVEAGRISSVQLSWSLHDFTDEAGDGPIYVGVAHSDYSDSEIEECVEVGAGGWDRGDKIAQERAKRLVRTIGVFRTDGAVALDISTLNEGMPIKTKLNWQLNTGDTLKFWAYNSGQNSLATGSFVQIVGHANLFLGRY